jgi:DNA repair protein RecN (Recombination protein N)
VLSQLTIRNFAIVDRLEIEWRPGLNVITGETGAGKSILIDAVGALLGDRLGPEVVRSGAQRALIEGLFIVHEPVAPELSAVLEQYGLEPEDGALIVSREIAGSGGRGGARINGRSVPLSILQELGECLVDVHGQSEHMALLRPREQLDYLDRYTGALADRAEVARLVRELRAIRAEHQALLASERETARLQDMLRHEVGEIENASLAEEEEQELLVQRARLEHVERLRQAATAARQALSTDDDGDDRAGAVDLLGRAVAALHEVGRIDPALAAEADALNGALVQAEDSARALRDYLESVEADPQALERTQERLFLIGDLKRKYGESVGEVLAYATAARGRLGEIAHRSERLDELQSLVASLETQLDLAGKALSGRRRAAAHDLERLVERELADLRLGDSRFVVALEESPVDATGSDRIEFLLAPTSGDAPRPIARVASGGELARLALALKTVLARAETRPTLIFDEVDVGVGGRTAPVVGEKLWTVAAAGPQVLCVTHMPQVAAFGDSHYVVSRSSNEVCVARTEGDQRLDELAAMLAGSVSETARDSARELVDRAAAVKAKGARAAPARTPARGRSKPA